jgi:energy-converting hydrogenase B subunit P
MKYLFEPGKVINLGGYICELVAKLPYRDAVVGNPLDEPVKIDVPIYSEAMIEAIREKGLIVRTVEDGEDLVDAINRVKKAVEGIRGKGDES